MPNLAQNMVVQPVLPPPTVETLDGVERYLSAVGSMKDKDLVKLSSEIWGEGYKYSGETLEQIRAELVGFLLDQKDLFLTIAPVAPQVLVEPQPIQPSPSMGLSGPSNSPAPSSDPGLK